MPSSGNPPTTKKARVEDGDYKGSAFELKCINTIRVFCADMVQKANSGHPGAPMGCAPLAYLLWSEIMNYSPSNPKWKNRDRFVLSNGHACALQYMMLHLTGYDLTLEDCMNFRQLKSKTPGHPESFVTPGIEVCTGPLGQGISNAVGIAIGERHLSATFPTAVFDHYTYVICGDGCLQEGVSSEACSLAGHLGLGKLIVLYDDNSITIDGPTSLSFTEDVGKRFEAYGWHVQSVDDVANGLQDLRNAIAEAQSVTDKPSMIKVKTVIGFGSMKQGSEKTHGAPLGGDDVASVKQKFGFDPSKSFQIDDDVKEFWSGIAKGREAKREEWDAVYAEFAKSNPKEYKELERRFNGESMTEEELLAVLPKFEYGKDKDKATRQFSEQCLNTLAPLLPEMIGGSADLTPSNLTSLKCSGDFQKDTPKGRYLRFGVREHGMSAICNGLFAYGAFRPFCATFLQFAGYAMGAIRLSALSRSGVIYIMTHDSIGLGEDGPTHQPIEMLECLRSTPNINVFRPADSNEMVAAYTLAIRNRGTPSVICCSRGTIPALEVSSAEKAFMGAYAVVDCAEPQLILVGTGSEVGLCVKSAEVLATQQGLVVRVVSMPCQEIFLQQSPEYQRSVLPGNIPTLSVEAAAISGWHRFAHQSVGMTSYGLSAPSDAVFEHFGFSVNNVVKVATSLVDFYKGKMVPNLMDRPELAVPAGVMNGGHH